MSRRVRLTTLRISCGRRARRAEFYGPLSLTGYQGETEAARTAPVRLR
jgi:hypothetical protein